MAILKTDHRAITDMSTMDLSGLRAIPMTVTPTTVIYRDPNGDHVTFYGTGIKKLTTGVPSTGSISGYTLVLSGIETMSVTGLDLGPGELESFILAGPAYAEATRLRLFRGDDTITGGRFDDHLLGGDGTDVLTGMYGDDSLAGEGGHDTVYGVWGADTLFGNDGDDLLYGGTGKDTLNGGDGADALYGGRDQDALYGGAGADRFAFSSIFEIDDRGAEADRIGDFQRGVDVIDLKAIDANQHRPGNQAFKFIGTRQFSDREGELRVEKKGAWLLVSGDIDGDGWADFHLRVQGTTRLDADDFIL